MLNENKISRRGLFMKLGFFSIGLVLWGRRLLAVPVLRFSHVLDYAGTAVALPVVGPSRRVGEFQKARRGWPPSGILRVPTDCKRWPACWSCVVGLR